MTEGAESSFRSEEVLEIFGQSDSMGFITPFLFCYELPDPSIVPQVMLRLRQGLKALAGALPWISGRVVKSHSGIFEIITTQPTPYLHLVDHRSNPAVPTMADLQQARFPTRMLDESLFSTACVLPGRAEEDRSRVFAVQVNQIRGGLIINYQGHHQALDGTGQEQICFLLDKACKGLPFTADEVVNGNLRRETIVKPFDDDWAPHPDSPFITRTLPADPETLSSPSPAVWSDVVFSPLSLQRLKEEASRQIMITGGFISTDDALTALLWTALSRARALRLSGDRTSKLSRAVNPRRHLGIPADYPGFISYDALSTQTLDRLQYESLGLTATDLRSAIDPDTSAVGARIREFITLLHRAQDKNAVAKNIGLDVDRDVMLSSWAGMRCYSFDFGLDLGRPVAFRRTLMGPVPSLIFLLPKNAEGEIVVTMGTRRDDVERMRGDMVFCGYGEFI